jgi:hypothetical protein
MDTREWQAVPHLLVEQPTAWQFYNICDLCRISAASAGGNGRTGIAPYRLEHDIGFDPNRGELFGD